MKPRFAFALVIASALLGGCADFNRPLVFPDPVALQDPMPGEAIVYFLRAPHDRAELTIRIDGALVASLPSATYTAVSLRPGTHDVTTEAASDRETISFKLPVTADQRRFFYASRPTETSSRFFIVPAGPVVVPVFTRTASPIGPRQWVEASESDAQGLLTNAKVSLPLATPN